MNNLLNVQKFSVNNTKQTFNKNECKLKETKYSWFTSIIVRVANKIAQVFGVKTISQQNLSNSIKHAGHYLNKHDVDIETACEVKSTISQIKKAFNEYLNSSKGNQDSELLRGLEYIIDWTIDNKILEGFIDDTESDTPLDKGFIGLSSGDYLTDDEITAMYLLNDEPLYDKDKQELEKHKLPNNYTYFLEGNSDDEIRIKTRIYK